MSDKEHLDLFEQKYNDLRNEMAKVIVGQQEAVDSLLLSVFTGGHCLLLGVPGLAKTLMVNTLAQTLGLTFSRIQFTPDLMPSDITGSEILDRERNFKFIQGPVFAGIVLADEINRTPPKTQAALLEAMQEHRVTVSGTSYPLPNQLDRFMFNVRLDYPSFEEEMQIVRQTTVDSDIQVQKILSADEILAFQQLIRRMPVPDNVVEYAVRLVSNTRPNTQSLSHSDTQSLKRYISWGAGPRASQYLIMGARTYAAMHGKYSPDAEDVRAVAFNVLRHRIVRNYYAEAENISTDQIINELLKDEK